MTEETISLKTRQLQNSQIIRNIDELIRNVIPERYSNKAEYFQITQWLHDKLQSQDEYVFNLYGLLVWECMDGDTSSIRQITRSILEDMTVLGEK